MADTAPKPDLARLVGDHHEVLYRYAFRLTGSVPDAEDLTQQTFLIAQQKLAQVRAEESLRGWLFTVLRNCYLKGFRKPTPLSAASLDLDIDSIAGPTGTGQTGAGQTGAGQTGAGQTGAGPLDSEELQRALDELPDEFKLVVTLFYFEEHSYREIAALLALPIGTVMSRLSRAKAHLRRRLRVPGEPAPATQKSGPPQQGKRPLAAR